MSLIRVVTRVKIKVHGTKYITRIINLPRPSPPHPHPPPLKSEPLLTKKAFEIYKNQGRELDWPHLPKDRGVGDLSQFQLVL